MMESSADSNAHLILILDDLHSLKSIQTSSILSWLPWTLPANVHLICSVTSTAESVLSILRTRISNDYFINLTPPTVDSAILMLHDMMQQRKVRLTTDSWSVVRSKIRSLHSTRVQATKRTISRTDSVAESKDPPLPSNDQKEEGVQQVVVVTPLFLDLLSGVVLSNFPADDSEDGTDNLPVLKETDIPESTSDLVNHVLQDLESQFGRVLVSKLCLYIGLTRYGFRETEILELISTEQEVTYEATWFKIKSVLCRNGECDGTGLLQESHVLGRTYFSWSHDVVTDAVRQRYLVSSSSSSKDCLTTHVHSELAHAFFLGFKEVRRKNPHSLYLSMHGIRLADLCVSPPVIWAANGRRYFPVTLSPRNESPSGQSVAHPLFHQAFFPWNKRKAREINNFSFAYQDEELPVNEKETERKGM